MFHKFCRLGAGSYGLLLRIQGFLALSLAFIAATKHCDGPTCNWLLLVLDVTFDSAGLRGGVAFHFTMADLFTLLESAEHVLLCLGLTVVAH